jgi:hypothetical protein
MVDGCHVVIRELPGDPGPAFCKWHRDGQPHMTKATLPAKSGPFMSRTEFGEDLYAAVQCCGEILQLHAMNVPEDDKREAALFQTLDTLLPKLSVADQEALLQRYPKLFTNEPVTEDAA